MARRQGPVRLAPLYSLETRPRRVARHPDFLRAKPPASQVNSSFCPTIDPGKLPVSRASNSSKLPGGMPLRALSWQGVSFQFIPCQESAQSARETSSKMTLRVDPVRVKANYLADSRRTEVSASRLCRGCIRLVCFPQSFDALPNAATKASYCLRVMGSIEPCRTLVGRRYLSQLGCWFPAA